MRSDCWGRLRFVVSHPFAENVNRRGTEVLSLGWRRNAGPSTAVAAATSAQDDSRYLFAQDDGRYLSAQDDRGWGLVQVSGR
jgi:hypothetical protein